MHRITCMEADRLARDLRQAAEHTQWTAHQHADLYAAMRIIGNRPLADYHHAAWTDAASAATQLADYAQRLTDRKPLWDNGTGPEQEYRPAVRLPQRADHKRSRIPASIGVG